jgi:uncharacterized membrane protein YfcA
MKSEMNYAWLVFHAFQILIFQFYAAPRLSQLTWKLLKKRDPEQAKALFGAQNHLHHPQWDYVIGMVSLLALIVGFMQANQLVYWSGKYLSLFGFLFTTMAIDLCRYEKIKPQLPLKHKRSATLVPRSFGRIVPLWAWAVCILASIGLVLIEHEPGKQFTMAIAVCICVAAAVITEKKSKITDNLEDDQLYRRSEAWTIFIIACTFPVFTPLRSYLGHYGIDAVFSTVPLLTFAWFLNSGIYRKLVA